MCEYCGCQSLASIDELTREHDEAVRLISHLRPAHEAGDVVRMAQVAREIAAVLGPHTRVEEGGLFPPWPRTSPTRSPPWRRNTGTSTRCWNRPPTEPSRATRPGRTG
ncbi:hemerythrin domain-containing protein [Streptomyces sp. INA 01156]